MALPAQFFLILQHQICLLFLRRDGIVDKCYLIGKLVCFCLHEKGISCAHQSDLHHTPYTLQVSIGAARLSDEIHTEKQWIEASDAQMYTEKAVHHQKDSKR